MKYSKIIFALCCSGALSAISLPALAAQPVPVPPPLKTAGAKVTASQAKMALPVKIVYPQDGFWQEVSKNNKLAVGFEERSLKYNKDTGIMDVWTRWEYNSLGPNNIKRIYLHSKYDVRLNTYSDLEQVVLDNKGTTVSSGPVADTSWNTISPDTLGSDLCGALRKHLLAM